LNTSTAPFPVTANHQKPCNPPVAAAHSGASVSIPDELSLVAFKGEMCLSFVFENFVWRTYGAPWLELAAQGRLDALSLRSCQALAHLNFGKYHHQREIELEGSIEYGHALRLLAPELSQPNRQGLESLLVAVLILLLYAVRHFQAKYTAYTTDLV
jgi:hypothetical protein